MGTIYQRETGGPFYAQWTDPKTGAHFKRSLKTRDRKVATERLRQYELVQTDPVKHSNQTLVPAIGNMLGALEKAGRPSSTRSAYADHGKPLVDVLGDIPLSQLTYAVLSGYLELRLKTVSALTVQKEFVTLRRTLAEARRREEWAGDVAALLPELKATYHPRDLWLTPEQAQELISEVGRASQPQLAGMRMLVWRQIWLATAVYTGARRSEVEGIRIEHIKFRDGHMLLPGTKRAKAWRHIPLHPDFAALLRPYVAGMSPSDRLVPRWTNVIRDVNRAMVRINERRAFKARKPVALWPVAITPNDLRRTFASWLIQDGRTPTEVGKLMGHGSGAMVERVYGHLADKNRVDAIASLPTLKIRKAA